MYKILLVDDEPALKMSIQTSVRWEEYGLCLFGTASNGQTALEFIESTPVDAVITDLEMPVMDGVRLIRALRDRGFSGPILVISNYSYYDYVRDALTAGAYDYILKANVYSQDMDLALKKMAELLSSEKAHTDVMPALKEKNDDSLSSDLFPATVCSVLFRKNDFPASFQPDFLSMTAEEVFEDISPKMIKTMQQTELLCIISENSLSEKEKDISQKLKRLMKQFQVYIGIAPSVYFIQGAQNETDVKEYHKRCRKEFENETDLLSLPKELVSSPKSNSITKPEVNSAIHYVLSNYMNHISLDDVAKYVNLNREYLCRIFHSETGLSLFSYINEVRMKKAADMFYSDPSLSVKEVSSRVGFENPYFFSKKFKDYFGIAPSEYSYQKNDNV